jgi:hypothetical protein
MKVGKTGLKMSSGKTIHFKSAAGRARFERVALAVKHGFKPTRGKR